MLNYKKRIGYILFSIALLSTSFLSASEVKVLNRNLDDLIADFNAQANKAKLLFIIGPTCSVCRKGLKEMKEEVLAKLPENSDLSVFVVNVPALDAEQKDIADTYSLFDDPRAVHYWDEMGTIRFQRTLELKSYAWDVWMIYQPGEKWEKKDPPKPYRWWHQLKGIDPVNRLDAKALSDTLLAVLANSTEKKTGAN